MGHDDRTCTTSQIGRCISRGTRVLAHSCTRPRFHTGPHSCKCQHTWNSPHNKITTQTTNRTHTTRRRGARRSFPKEQS